MPRSPPPEPAGRLDVRPCPGIPGFSCGSLGVRLDPSGAAPGRLSLRVAVADAGAAPRGMLLLLTGGPGEPGVPFASRLAGRLGPALRGYRMVLLDQRGTGAGALDCPDRVSRLILDSVVPSWNVDPLQLAGLHASTLCADMPMPWGGPGTPMAARAAALARVVARLTTAEVWPFDRATAGGNGFIQTCLYWPPVPVPAAAAALRARLPRVPVLLLAGGHDLSTPLAGARAQAALAPDGHLFVVPRAGHSVQNRAAGNPVAAAVARFLAA